MKTPRIVENQHIGKRALVRHKGRLIEGTIEELSPSAGHFRHGEQWLDNEPGQILEILPPRKKDGKPTRFSVTKKGGN
ncbi:MAG: hypothetical protein AAFX93_15820 [Verrucomicrobiota bacterium]